MASGTSRLGSHPQPLPPVVTMSYRLLCAILGEDSSFTVAFNKTQIVDELKETIKEKDVDELAPYNATSLTLFKINAATPDGETFERVIGDIRQASIEGAVKMHPIFTLSTYFNDEDFCQPKVHIAIQLPRGESIDPRLCGAVA